MSYLKKVRQPIKAIAPIEADRAYETADAARVITCSAHTITELCKAGDVKFSRNGRKYRIKGSELLELVRRDQAMRTQRTETKSALAALLRPAKKEEAFDVGQMDMLDTVPRHYRINISPKVYMRLRQAAREMNITLSDLASMLLAAGLQGREQE
jgi:excisionase family DNA binding protein